MNLDGLRKEGERRLRRTERNQAMYALAGKHDVLERHRFVRLARIDLASYLQVGDQIELHRSLLPADERDYGGTAPARTFGWKLWTVVPVERIGPDCLRILLPRYGSMPIPASDFVRAVMVGNARAPSPGGHEPAGPCSDP
jgi:hypothetical protein